MSTSFRFRLLRPIGKHLTMAVGSIYASYQLSELLIDLEEAAKDEEAAKYQLGRSMLIQNVLPIPLLYSLHNHLPKGGKKKIISSNCFFPNFCGRLPILIPYSIAAGVLAAFPLYFFGHAAAAHSPSPIELHRHDSDTNNSNNTIPGTKSKSSVISGTTLGPTMESKIPGSFTVLIPVCDELFYRRLLFRSLMASAGFCPAAICSSMLSGCVYDGDSIDLDVSETVIGCISCVIYYSTGGVLAPISFHATYNALKVLFSAIEPTVLTVGKHWLDANQHSRSSVECPKDVLSVWGRIVHDNFRAIYFLNLWLISRQHPWGDAEQKVCPFLPLDFWGKLEGVSPHSIFACRENKTLLNSPLLFDDDGSSENIVETLIEDYVQILFRNSESISMDQMNEHSVREMYLQLIFHILATTPQVLSIEQDLFACFDELDKFLSVEQKVLLDEKNALSVGINLMLFRGRTITRSEFKKMYTDRFRVDSNSEINRSMFFLYCLSNLESNSSIQDLLVDYCGLAKVEVP